MAKLYYRERPAITGRFKRRNDRRDPQRPNRFVFSETGTGASVAFGLFDGDDYTGAVEEITIPGLDVAALEQQVATPITEADAGALLAQQLKQLEQDLFDESILAERARKHILYEV